MDVVPNGLFLLNGFIPEEVVSIILLHLNWKELIPARLVCQTWKRLIDHGVCFDKIKHHQCSSDKSKILSEPINLTPKSLPFHICFAIGQGAIGTNHLKNAFGSSGSVAHKCEHCRPSYGYHWGAQHHSDDSSEEDCPRYRHWQMISSGGNGWAFEAEPAGCDPLPEHLAERSCFVTSYGICAKEQLITLSECGLNGQIMDSVQPHIEVSEWFARRFDCGVRYRLEVALLNSEKSVVDQFREEQTGIQDIQWHQVIHTFKEYGKGVRYVLFRHGGKDTQFWAGHYGSKMAGGSVVAKIPASFINNHESS